MGGDAYFDCCQSVNLEWLNLWGKGYIAEHCRAVLRRRQEDRRLKAYLTDALMCLTENTAGPAGGRRMAQRWADGLARPGDMSAPDVAALMRRAGLTFREA